MAGLRAILTAVRRAVARDLESLGSLKVNHLFLFVLLLVYGALNSGQPPKSAEPFFVLLGFLLLFPLSSDPLRKIPPSRLVLWPLRQGQRIGLRLASLFLSPLAWIAIAILVKTARLELAVALCGLALTIQLAIASARHAAQRNRHFNLLGYIPLFPGKLGGLISKNLREVMTLLDPYAALALSAGGLAYRIYAPSPDKTAFSILGLLVALTLSTYAQSLFGIELTAGSGITRYRLLPLRGWETLLAKDFAFLAILLLLLLPLDIAPGMTFGLVALAFGHHSSVMLQIPQQPWRFTGGRLLPVGAIQALVGMGLGFLEFEKGIGILLVAAAAYLASLAHYGRVWERRTVA